MNRVAEPYLKVTDVVNGFELTRVVQVAVELDIFSKLANEGKTAAQLSVLLDVNVRSLELVLNALTGAGFLQKEAERFSDTPISHTYLSASGPKYLGHLIRHQARRWDEWGRLEESLRTGRPVREPDMYQADAEELELFVRGMHALAIARGDARYLSRAIPLKRCRKLLDLGGGPGTYASMFCRANRNLQAVVMDLPATLKVTRKILREFDRSGRVSTMSGDYRKDKIKGAPYDVVLMSNILHSEDEETNRALLHKVHDALTPGGILIVKDHVLSADHTAPADGAMFAIQLMLTTRGRGYSFAEISGWLEESDFQDMVEVPMEPPMNVSLVLALRQGPKPLAVLPKPAAKVDDQRGSETTAVPEGMTTDGSVGSASANPVPTRTPKRGSATLKKTSTHTKSASSNHKKASSTSKSR